VLDAWAQAGALQGSLCVSLQWGAWAGTGMAAQNKSTMLRMERLGLGMLTAEQGVSALASALRRGTRAPAVRALAPQLTVNAFRWPAYLAHYAAAPAVFSNFRFAQPVDSSMVVSATPAAVAPVSRASLEATLQREVSAVVAGVLGAQVGEDEPLMEAGLDSLSSVEFRHQLERAVGMQVPGASAWRSCMPVLTS